MAEMQRVTLFVMHGDDDTDYRLIEAWFARWKTQVVIVDYSTGGWEHLWDIEATAEAIANLQPEWLCSSKWSESKLP